MTDEELMESLRQSAITHPDMRPYLSAKIAALQERVCLAGECGHVDAQDNPIHHREPLLDR